MKHQKLCKSCGRTFVIGEGEIQPLSREEQLLCAKEDLPWPLMVKVVCGYCGTPALVEESRLERIRDDEPESEIRIEIGEPQSAPQPAPAPAPTTPPPPAAGTAPITASEGKKRCPDCAEEINADARICRYCRYDYEKAAVDARVAAAGAIVAAQRAVQEIEKLLVEKKLGRIRKVENAKVKVILLAHAGLLAAPLLLMPFIVEQERSGAEPPDFMLFLMLAVYVTFGVLAVLQWRKSRRLESDLAAEARRDAVSYDCLCGRPIRNYGAIHYILCAILIPYGYASLLFRKGRCSSCKRPYQETLKPSGSG